MLLYRVFPYLEKALVGQDGHPCLILKGQGKARFDNPELYDLWYLALEPASAVGERFGQLHTWSEAMFDHQENQGARRSLAVFQLPNNTPLLDFDNAQNLLARSLRPTSVIDPNRPATQLIGQRVFEERNRDGARLWDGIGWWSWYLPQWRLVAYWGELQPELLEVQRLDLEHSAVREARESLVKPTL